MNDTNYAADFVDLFLKGVERAAELQKKALEAATQQTTEAIAASKKAIQPAMSGMSQTVRSSKVSIGMLKRRKVLLISWCNKPLP